jgi:hypothetical protein
MHTTTTTHVHPAEANPHRIFEIRRLARIYGCTFIASKPKLQQPSGYMSHDPKGGGRAA